MSEPESTSQFPDPITQLYVDRDGNFVNMTEFPDGNYTQEITHNLNGMAEEVRILQTLRQLESPPTTDTSVDSLHASHAPNLDKIREEIARIRNQTNPI